MEERVCFACQKAACYFSHHFSKETASVRCLSKSPFLNKESECDSSIRVLHACISGDELVATMQTVIEKMACYCWTRTVCDQLTIWLQFIFHR